MGQWVTIMPNRQYRLRFRARSRQGRLSFQVHEKSILYSNGGIELTGPPNFTPKWRDYETSFDSGHLGAGSWLSRRATMLFFYNWGDGTVVDLDDVALSDESGHDLIRNGHLSAGHDWWVFESQHHTAYQAKNMYVGILFEQGLLGLVALTLLLGGALASLELARRRAPDAAAAIVGNLAGVLLLGLTDNLLSSPRLATLLLCLALFLGLLGAPHRHSQNRRRGLP